MALLLDPLFEFSRGLERLWAPGQPGVRAFGPPADVLVSKEEARVVMDLPGLTQDDIEIEVAGDVLTVRGERKLPYGPEPSNGHTWHRLERGFGKFERSLRLPQGLEPGAITASLIDGVLRLRIPVAESRKPRRIQIDAEHKAVDVQAREPELAGATA